MRGSGIEVLEVESEPRACYSFAWILDIECHIGIYISKNLIM